VSYNISTMIPNTAVDSELISKYNSIIQTLKNNHTATTLTVTPSIANMYIGDLYGLFKVILNVPLDSIYPNMVANGYKCSQDYNGDKVTFIILDNDVINDYVRLFKKTY